MTDELEAVWLVMWYDAAISGVTTEVFADELQARRMAAKVNGMCQRTVVQRPVVDTQKG